MDPEPMPHRALKQQIQAFDGYREVVEHLSTAVVVVDNSLRVAYVNPAAEQLFAMSATSLRGIPLEQFWWESGRNMDGFHQSFRDHHPFTRREALLTLPANPQPALVDYSVTPITDHGAELLLLEVRPLERLVRMSREESLVAAHQATRALVRGVAHEVKNPLGGIRGAAQLLARELNNAQLQEYTEIIISETDRLRNLVDMMLGPRKPMEFRHTNVHQVVERVRSLIQAEVGKDIYIDRDYDPSLPEIWADNDQLIQAIMNIVRNACQALQENRAQRNPRILLRTRAMRQYTIGTVRHRLSCLVEIEDNGPGIPRELEETLFYPMVSGRPHGTGLGLSIAQSIISQHRGSIECDSHPGRTVFKLLLPIDPPEDT
jgi:two-component system nitrogen regulation sensor histidine kinase GlnL